MMARHNIHRMYVLQYQAQPKDEALSPIFPGAVASLNTHDMPTFAAFWQGLTSRIARHWLLDKTRRPRTRARRE